MLPPRDGKLTERLAPVDEQSGAGPCGHRNPLQDVFACLGVAAVESADADGEHEVEGFLVGQQDEVFRRDLADAHPAGGDLLGRDDSGLRNRCGGPVDGQDVPGDEPVSDSPGGRTRAAPDLQDAQIWP